MVSKNQPSPINRKLVILSLFFLFILYVLLNAKPSSFRPIITSSDSSSPQTCNKIPLSLSESLLHYATGGIDTTPQQSLQEISVTLRVLEKKSPCNFLVFGLGQDSLLWASLNYKGRTVFLEDSKFWMAMVKKQFPSLEMYLVPYDTKLNQADELFDIGKKLSTCQIVIDPRMSKCPLAIKNLPNEVYETEWDLIMVDAPMGYNHSLSPGRMKVIYTAGLLAKNKKNGETDVFVHDVNRAIEDKFSSAFLCEAYRKEQVGRIRHFNIPSHRTGNRPFCS
ncbi:hypothetical protein CASFOL_016443 [Castilleja foliolosa]|uniref:Polysaccharide biosynthesis domain-containing protein n=1 Tax=Castilleja foliolosa TaxID=1961234 RepID=A0ABD3DGL6_9LAMI